MDYTICCNRPKSLGSVFSVILYIFAKNREIQQQGREHKSSQNYAHTHWALKPFPRRYVGMLKYQAQHSWRVDEDIMHISKRVGGGGGGMIGWSLWKGSNNHQKIDSALLDSCIGWEGHRSSPRFLGILSRVLSKLPNSGLRDLL